MPLLYKLSCQKALVFSLLILVFMQVSRWKKQHKRLEGKNAFGLLFRLLMAFGGIRAGRIGYLVLCERCVSD
ncbi:hypothetical protein L484_007473 [Morus notabilis]|uniref:Uncharacterized protein n=1 Tax=Morus notabilis TaxID=981085 RepID=W9RWF8_9ROSA|nr:hypothetical protein L484_007473 [Morus notabilis]